MSDRHHRKSIRLKGWDYTRPGAYFITVCVKDRECLFGEIVDGKVRLNECGQIVQRTWEWLATQYAYVKLDEYQVMPNHFHGILWIRDVFRGDSTRIDFARYCKNGSSYCRGGSRTAPTNEHTPASQNVSVVENPPPISNVASAHNARTDVKPVGRLVGAFKTVSTKYINRVRTTPGAIVWQRDFYDHIGRDEEELSRIRQYIRDNPANWGDDEENPSSPRYVALPNPQFSYSIRCRQMVQ